MNNDDLLRKLDDQPFRPFRICLEGSTSYDIRHPGMILVGNEGAVVATRNNRDKAGRHRVTDWRTISISHILRLEDVRD